MGGDAADLVMRVNKVDFPAAVKFLADLSGMIPPSKGTVPVIPAGKSSTRPPEEPSGLSLEKHHPSCPKRLPASGDLEARTLARTCVAVASLTRRSAPPGWGSHRAS